MKKTQLLTLTFLLITALFMGCGTKAVYITVTRPAEVNMKNFDKIAVGEIKVNGSGVFSEELMQALFESERFEVLDHESLKMSLSQNDLVMSSLTDGGNEEEIRKIFGNLALISGKISGYDYEEDVTHKDVERTDKETGKVTTTRTYYRTGTARVSVSLRVVDLRTSKILANRKFTESQTKGKSRKSSRPSSIDRASLFEACREEIIGSFMRMIVPYTERVYVSFETTKEMPELASGFNMAKLGNWDAAIDIFQKATGTYSNSPLVHKAYYNLGLSYMYADRFDEARTALEEAYVGKPESKYKKAIDELNVRIEDRRRLEEQRRVDLDAEEGEDSGAEDVATGQKRAVLQGHTDLASSVSFSPDGQTLASASGDKTIRLWEVASGQEKAVLQGHTDLVISVSFSPDGQTLASASRDKTIRLWEVESGWQKAVLQGHTDLVISVSFSPDGQTLASASGDKTIRLWEVESGQEKAVLQGHTDLVISVSFSPDGQTLASASGDKTIRLWEVESGWQKAVLQGHRSEVMSVSFSPDGQTLASASRDNTVRLWEVESGQEKAVLQGHTDLASSVSFSPDGQTLASASKDNTIRLWEVESGQEKAVLQGHTEPVTSVSFSPDGQTLASASYDNTIRLWDMVP